MRRQLMLILAAFALAATLATSHLTTAPVSAEPTAQSLYLIGDSWSTNMAGYGTFEAELSLRGLDYLTVHPWGKGGSTLLKWLADNPCGNGSCPGHYTDFKEALAADTTENPIVFVNLGGLDLTTQYSRGPGLGDAVFNQMEDSFRSLVGELIGVRSDVQVVLISYDILNYGQSRDCRQKARDIFGTHKASDINALFEEGHVRQAVVAAEFAQAEAAYVVGALQGDPGNPNLRRWSPEQYVKEDCNHLTEAGYTVYGEAIIDAVFGAP